ncbi:MAG: diacylglycerol/polyprenol kinase family protein [Candidatus Paceibacteria bacterium]
MLLGLSLKNEIKRKLLHIFSGVLFLIFLLVFGRTKLAVVLVMLLLGGLLIINLLIIGWKTPFTDWFINNFERPKTRFPGYATAWYVAGLLIATTILHEQNEIAAVVCSLAFGDGISTIFGERGKMRLPYNKEKTLEGLIAFFCATLISIFFVGWIGVLFALSMAVFESLPIGLDDNFRIPLFGAAFFSLF